MSKVRQFTVRYSFSRMGRSGASVICAVCGGQFEVYWWSLAGCGKRCPHCKALYLSIGLAEDVLAKLKAAEASKARGEQHG